MAIRLGDLPDRSRPHRFRLLYRSPCPNQPSRIRPFWYGLDERSLLLLRGGSIDDVSLAITILIQSHGPKLMLRHRATFVKARNVFNHNGISTSLGRYAFGFTWGAWAAMFLATVMLFVGCGLGGRNESTRTSGGGFFGKRRAKRAKRGSFVDNDSQRRVKDEYA